MSNYWVKIFGLTRRNAVEIDINLPHSHKLKSDGIFFIDKLHNGYWITSEASLEHTKHQFDIAVKEIIKSYEDDETLKGYMDLPVYRVSCDIIPLTITLDVLERCTHILDQLGKLSQEQRNLQREYSSLKNVIRQDNDLN